MKTFLADLTHTTITISNDSFPLNVGLVGAHCQSFFPDLNIKLFKYPEKLISKINQDMPDILGLSNYPWNHYLNISIAKYVKSKNKNVIIVFGGPYISYDSNQQEVFMARYKGLVDFYCMFEGETSFKSLLDSAHQASFDISKMKKSPIEGCLFLSDDGRLAPFIPITRSRSIDDYPSPYKMGLMDEFFDGKLSPMIETHRGCPYSCTFCHEGHDFYRKISRFDSQRIKDELEYIAERVGNKVNNLIIADPNYGQFKSDVELAEYINEVFDRHNYPSLMYTSSAKNNQDNLIKISKTLKHTIMPLRMSVQSMTDDVLENIKRKNISIDAMMAVQNSMRTATQGTESEVIMPLPGETFESHIESISKLMNSGLDKIIPYQLMLLDGSEMKLDESMDQHEFVKKYRVLPRSASDLDFVGKSIEIEEIVVATNTFSFEEYSKARVLHLMIATVYNGGSFGGFFKLAREHNINLKEFLFKLHDNFVSHPSLSKLHKEFVKETHEEIFDSYEETASFYLKSKNFNLLINGEIGKNLLQTYSCIAYLSHASDLVDLLENTLKEVSMGVIHDRIIKDLAQFYRLGFKNYLDINRLNLSDNEFLKFDIPSWLQSRQNISEFEFHTKTEFIFFTSPKSYDYVESYFERYGRSAQAFGKILTRLWIKEILREVKVASTATVSQSKALF
jgi:radical SAM superfamily enzyme YgiQ (UPF0313 family)